MWEYPLVTKSGKTVYPQTGVYDQPDLKPDQPKQDESQKQTESPKTNEPTTKQG